MARNLFAVIDDDRSVGRTTAVLVESFRFRVAAFESALSHFSESPSPTSSYSEQFVQHYVTWRGPDLPEVYYGKGQYSSVN